MCNRRKGCKTHASTPTCTPSVPFYVRSTPTGGAGEDALVVELLLHPGEQQRHVLLGRHRRGRPVGFGVGPQVLVLGARVHDAAGGAGGVALVGDDPEEEARLVVRVHRWVCKSACVWRLEHRKMGKQKKDRISSTTVDKIDGLTVHGQPLVGVLGRGAGHRRAGDARGERRLAVAVQRQPLVALSIQGRGRLL